jgi:hypothetical protein
MCRFLVSSFGGKTRLKEKNDHFCSFFVCLFQKTPTVHRSMIAGSETVVESRSACE